MSLSPDDGQNDPVVSEPGVFILLPILNERDNIGPLLDQIEKELAGRAYTIRVLDDGSTDGTVSYLEERVRRSGSRIHLTCRKKRLRSSQRGGALLTLLEWGVENTHHEIFVEMDGDLSHRPEELSDGIRWIAAGGADVAIASRYVPGGNIVNRPLGRRLVSSVCSAAVGTLISWRIRDYSNGYRFYNRAAAELVTEHKIRYGSPIYLSEVLALWLRSGLRVTEFPSTYIGRQEGLSKLRMRDLAKASIAIFEISARYHLFGFPKREPKVKPALSTIE